MKALVLLPLFSCLVYTALATVILARDHRHPTSWLGAAICGSAGWWALCEVLWTTATDPETVLLLVKLSGFGWMLIGCYVLHLFLYISGSPARHLRSPVMPAIYGVGAVSVVLDFTTPWLHPAVMETNWGWAYTTGPLFPVASLFATLPIVVGMTIGIRSAREHLPPSEWSQMKVVLAGLSIPLVIATVTDGVLPTLGHAAPRFGTTSITILMVTIAWGFHRYGYSLLAPGNSAWDIVSTIQDGVALVRIDGKVRIANPALERLLGASAREIEGRSIEELIGSPLDLDAEVQGEELLLCAAGAGEGEVPVELSTSFLRDKGGAIIGMVLVLRDLREVALLRNRLVLSDRLAAVGQLAAGIAHEINNPIAYVRANLASFERLLAEIEDKLPEGAKHAMSAQIEEGRELAAESIEGVERVAAIVRNVKEFSHSGASQHEAVDLERLLGAAIRVANPQRPPGCSVHTDFATVPPVVGSAQELKQVFLNLLINAFQSCEDGEVRVSLRREGARAVVLFEDSGCGMAPETLERIFDPFFTTKSVGEGTGLGLSISYQILRSHGGEMSVSSELGRGTSFRVSLPLASG